MMRLLLLPLILAGFVHADVKNVDVKGSDVTGLVAAVFTPFDASGAVAYSAIAQQAAYLNATGVRWAFVSGTTGESVKLTPSERKSLISAWCDVGPAHGVKIIAHVGDESIETAKSLAAAASSFGASAIAAMPTVFFKPANVEALALAVDAIASAAPSLPFFYYHIPSMTGVSYPSGLLPLVKAVTAPNFAGIKYTGLYTYPGFMDAERIMRAGSRVLSGRDEMMIQALIAGIDGFVGSQYNFAGDMYNAIIDAFNAGDVKKARDMQLAMIDLIAAWSDVPEGVNGCKNVLNVAPGGFAVGDARLPSIPISGGVGKLKKGIEDWCAGIRSGGLFSSSKMCNF